MQDRRSGRNAPELLTAAMFPFCLRSDITMSPTGQGVFALSRIGTSKPKGDLFDRMRDPHSPQFDESPLGINVKQREARLRGSLLPLAITRS